MTAKVLKKLELSERQTKTLAALACGIKAIEAAEEAGVSTRTVYRWATSPTGSAFIEAQRQKATEILAAELPSLIERSLAVMSDRLDCQVTQARTAEFILRFLGRPLLAGLDRTEDAPIEAALELIEEERD